MLNLKDLITNKDIYFKKLKRKNIDENIFNEIITLSSARSDLMTSLQKFESERNYLSKEIGIKKFEKEDANDLFDKVSLVKKEIDKIKGKEQEVNEIIASKLLYLPNLPHDDVPDGKDESDNVVLNVFDKIGRGKVTGVKPHYEIAVKKDIVDFERAVKLSGSRFWSYKGDGAKLVRSLENFMLDEHIKNGYVEIIPPLMVKGIAMQGAGQLPKFVDDLFKIEGKDSYLIPTAEVPLTNFYAGEIIDLSNKVVALTAYTPCFRAEAGSGGKDVKGLIRAHQFNKVEMVKFVKPENKMEEFDKTVKDAKNILDKLELPYQELLLCVGDLGFSSEMTIDLEIWIPSENRFRETSSISTFGDYQGRRASIRYKDKNKNNQYVSTINGSGLAIDRVVAAILENYQNKDGSISIPKVLVPYMGKEEI